MEEQSFRIQRINQLILRELVMLLSREIKDSRLKNLEITEVITSKDLSYSKVFFNTKIDNKKEIAKLINNATGFLRSRLARNLKLRHMPQLTFYYDHSQNTGNRIDELLNNL